MEKILKHYDNECEITLTMDYKDYITLMNCLMNCTGENYETDARMLFESIEESSFKVLENTNY